MSALSSGRILFESKVSAVQALITVLEDARNTEKTYTFSGLNHQRIMQSGLVLDGEIAEIKDKVLQIEGTLWSEY